LQYDTLQDGFDKVTTRDDSKQGLAMTQSHRLLDELARLATDGLGAAQGLKREVQDMIRSQLEKILHDLDVPSREEVDAIRLMAVKAREENEALKLRVSALEEALASKGI
jgi:BMFP domain-containing protein YqiC